MRVEILIIQRYLKYYLVEQKRSWPEAEFRHTAYARWACQELINKINDDPKTPAIFIIEKFKDDMDRYSEMGTNPKKNIIFSIARETTKDLLELM